jgi:hypothetical protein
LAREAGFSIATEPPEEWIQRVKALGSAEHELTLSAAWLNRANRPGTGRAGSAANAKSKAEASDFGLVKAPSPGRLALQRYFAHRRASANLDSG